MLQPLGDAGSQTGAVYTSNIFTLDPNQLLPVAKTSRVVLFLEY